MLQCNHQRTYSKDKRMNNPIMTRIDDELFKLLDEYSKNKHWKISQTVREIVAQFFNYELSANDG